MTNHIYDTYDLGRSYPQMPIPLVAEQCIDIAAGPLTFVIESRDLANSTTTPDAFGGTVHVVSTDGRVEYLRFDCFDDIPHYHYLRPDEPRNTIVRFDEHAGGDPIEWTIERLQRRLPEMLDYADAGELAQAVRSNNDQVQAAVATVRDLLTEAKQRALDHRASGGSLSPSS